MGALSLRLNLSRASSMVVTVVAQNNRFAVLVLFIEQNPTRGTRTVLCIANYFGVAYFSGVLGARSAPLSIARNYVGPCDSRSVNATLPSLPGRSRHTSTAPVASVDSTTPCRHLIGDILVYSVSSDHRNNSPLSSSRLRQSTISFSFFFVFFFLSFSHHLGSPECKLHPS